MKMKNRKGSILITTLLIFVVLMTFGTFILGFMVNENKMSLNHQYKTQAYYIARSGAVAVEAAIMDMDEDEVKQLKEELDNGDEIIVNEIDLDGNKANVIIKKEDDNIVIEAIGKVENSSDIVVKVLDITTVELSDKVSIDHAVFSDEDIKFNNGTIEGDIATNGNINIDGWPTINGDAYLRDGQEIKSTNEEWIKQKWSNANNKKLDNEITYPLHKFPDYFNENPIDMPKLPMFPNYNNNPKNLPISPDIRYASDVNEKMINISSRYEKITMGWNKILIIDARYENIDIWVEELTNLFKVVIKGSNRVNLHVKSKFETNYSNGIPFNFEGDAELNIYYSGKGENFTTNNGGNEMKANLYLNPSSHKINISSVRFVGDIYVYNGNFDTGGSLKNPRVIGDIYSLLGNVSIPSGDVEGSIYINEGDFTKSSGGNVTGDIYLNKGDVKMPNGNLIGNIYINEGDFIKLSGGNITGNIHLNKGSVTMPNGNVTGDIYLKQGNFTKTGSGNIIGNLYQNKGEIDLTGSGHIKGSIITNGNKIVIKGGAKIAEGIVYAPNADVKLTGSGSVHCALIAKNLSSEGGAKITYDKDIVKDSIVLINPDISEENKSTTTIIKPGYFK